MSAYSREDIEEAFLCSTERLGPLGREGLSVNEVRECVLGHLNSNCPCDRRKCQKCGLRPMNKVPTHKPECPNALRDGKKR